MIPILYEKTETTFTSNGICRLADCISCIVHEERNGEYECEFEYPVTGAHFADIIEGRIIAVTHDETGDVQPFDIYRHEAPINGVVTFRAHHISYRQSGITVKPFTASSITQAIQGISTNSVNTNAFTYWTDKSTAGNYTVTEPRSARSLLCGEEGSLLDVYGTGEYEFDKFTVKLHAARGTASGVTIRYGKNLVDIEDELDYSNSYTGIVPYWIGDNNGTETMVNVTGWVVRSGETSYGTRDIIIPKDMSEKFETMPTAAQLQTAAETDLANGEYWLPNETIKVDFVQLWQTEEYKEFAPLQRVKLCDTVSVYYPALNITIPTVKVIETTYNVLLDRYDEMVLGDAQKTFAALISESVKVDTSGLATKADLAGIEAEIQAAVDNATELITGGLGGYVYIKPNANGKPEEILIMNTDNINTATKVWRWNVNGLGYSSTGYSGTYGTAITMDGQIVADFITTGTLNANLIRAGVITDTAGQNSWNLTSGAMTLHDATFYGNNDLVITKIGDTLYMRNEDTTQDIAFIHLRDSDIWNGSTVYKHARLYADKLTFTATDNTVATIQYVGAKTIRIDENLEVNGVLYGPTMGGLSSQYPSTLRYTTLDNTCNISALVDSAINSSSTNPVQNKAIHTALTSKADSSDIVAIQEDMQLMTTVIQQHGLAINQKAPLASPALTGTPTAPTASAGTNTTQIATTAFVTAAIAAIPGVDLSGYAKLANPAFTGIPTAPTAAAGTNTTQIATTAFVQTAMGGKAPTDHHSSTTTYGLGDASNYGHLKLLDGTGSTLGVNGGTAATPKAVADALTQAKSYTDQFRGGISGETGNVTLSSSTSYTTITDSITLTAGRYVLFGHVRFDAAAAASRRGCNIYDETAGSQLADSLVQINVTTNGGAIHLTTSTCLAFSSPHTFVVRAMQNSGSSVAVEAQFKAIKISDY